MPLPYNYAPFGLVAKSITSNVGRAIGSNAVMGYLPPNAYLTSIQINGTTASDAGTSSTLSIGSDGGGGSEFLAAFNLKTAPGQAIPSSAALGATGDKNPTSVTVRIDEAGGASSTGGPWNVRLEYL